MTSTAAEADPPEPVPDTCLSFTVSGPWAHFRRIDGNVVKQTYRVIPRTTVAGLVAGMLGIGRDEYYEYFAPDESAIAVEPVSELRTINLPTNTLSTADENITHVPSGRQKLKIGLPDPTEPRQQHNYEVLVDPAYRIDLWLSDESIYTKLRDTLHERKSHYVPSLGLSEYLADIEYHGEFHVETADVDGRAEVNSAVPNADKIIVPEVGLNYGIERSPAFMEKRGGGRTTTGFTSYGYSFSPEPLPVQGVTPRRVDGRSVLFV